MEQLLTELTVWHWLALGLVLFGIEMMTGTFDLLMIALAAWMTAAFAAIAPENLSTWQAEAIFFGVASAILVVLGRTLFSGAHKRADEHPTLNKRMSGLLGKRGVATGDFSAGTGQIKIGDTVWGAEAIDGQSIKSGDEVVVEGANMTSAIVRLA